MSLVSILLGAWGWFKKTFISHSQSADSIAVVVTETIKNLLANPVVGFLENVADAITGTQVPTAIGNLINAGIQKVFTVELAIEGLPDNPTPADILAYEQRILGAFNVTANNSKLYTVLAAQVYGIIQSNIDGGKTKFADWVNAIEQAYLDYKKDLAANAPVNTAAQDIGIVNAPPGTVLSSGNEVLP